MNYYLIIQFDISTPLVITFNSKDNLKKYVEKELNGIKIKWMTYITGFVKVNKEMLKNENCD